MPDETVLVTLHIHTDGPIPGPHSLLTLSSAAYAESVVRPRERGGAPVGSYNTLSGDGLIGTFSANVRELPGATLHPVSLEHWRTRAADWLSTRRAARPPALTTDAYLRWVGRLPGTPTLVTDPVEPDYLFLYWYLYRFTGQWPFARTSTDADLRQRLPRPLCPLSGCRATLAQTSCRGSPQFPDPPLVRCVSVPACVSWSSSSPACWRRAARGWSRGHRRPRAACCSRRARGRCGWTGWTRVRC